MKTTPNTLTSLLKQGSLHARLLLAGLLLVPLSSPATDIDIYAGLPSGNALPNVLLVMDNSANFVSSALPGPSTCSLTNTATGVTANNSLAGSTGGIEQCALHNVIQGLPTDADGTARVNIGFMVYNSSGITDYQGQNCQSGNGGCLVYPLKPMSGTARQNMLDWITTWKTNNGGAGSFWIKANGQATAATMQEAWAYYAGRTGLSGRSYASIQPTAGCQKNFVIFIGNAYAANSSPGDSTGPAAALTTAYGADPVPGKILGTINTVCGSATFPTSNTHETGGFYADEWARFMHNSADIFSTTIDRQHITTYTIGLHGASCKPDYAALLDTMAAHGGGKYFVTSDGDSIVQALLRILNEVQAVNSVFSSATLPVSVNTQGTYLNQIYMGMFRPDSAGTPRWVGNVKQYQFWFDANKKLYLADATKKAAISSSGTGFIAPDAASFWSCRSSANAASDPALASPYSALPRCALDPAGGFWHNYTDYVANSAGGAFDLSDGEVVEKGGASQQLRLSNLTASYPASPRKLYTYCPSGSGCTPALYDAANAFTTSNTNITASMFGTGVNLTITSIDLVDTDLGIAKATTSGTHNLVTGNTLTIVGASPNDYNGLVTVTATGSNWFKYAVQVYPPVTAIGSYVASQSGTISYPLTLLERGRAGTANTATVTATMASVPFADNASVTIGGATPSIYNLSPTINLVNNQTFDFPITVNPPYQATGSFVVSLANAPQVSISSYSCSNRDWIGKITTGTAHGLRTGDQITISGDPAPSNKTSNGTFTGILVLTPTSFWYNTGGCPGTAVVSPTTVVQGGPVTPLAVSLTRNETAVGTALVTATLANSRQFANGDLVNITAAPSTTTPSNETGYLVSSQAISCSSNPCGTTFTFTIATTPAQQPGGSITVTAAGEIALPITSLSRSGSTATATVTGAGFNHGDTINILTAPGTTQAAHEEAYTGSYNVICDGGVGTTCTTFTYLPLTITPDPGAGAEGTITASNPGLTPDRDSLINWIRGEDNFGDEKSLCPPGVATGTANCPSTRVTVRPSVHGDALHSRPIALNYGGSIGVVVYYGTNDGVYHAINGNQTAAIGSTPAGGELWGFIARDFYDKFNRQRSNSPVLLQPNTPPGIFPAPQPKDYFIDGPTGMYQTIDGNGVTTKAIIYIAARRGGRFIHAVDVTNPSMPKYLWKISDATAGFEELGQTWSQPKVAWLRGYSNPVLIFGAGYDDGSEDREPPLSATLNGSDVDKGSDNMGRGIFIADALTGDLVWHARHYSAAAWIAGWVRTDVTGTTKGADCTGTPPAAVICDVRAMNYSIPSDVTLMDKDQDGFIERLYATDNGGNVWRLDFEPAGGVTPDNWQVTQLAALGCPNGPCSADLNTSSTARTQRKFFFPPEVIALRSKDYDAVFVGSGDREHPLLSQEAYNVTNRLYMLKDFNKGKDSVSQEHPISENSSLYPGRTLADCTGGTCSVATTGADTAKPYCDLTNEQQRSGYYFTLGEGEKVVNAPLTTAGYVYFGTNQPEIPDALSCGTKLGKARGYQLSPFCAQYASVIFDGGGLPPSPVSGIVDIINDDGSTTHAPFCVGCATPLTSGTGEVIDCKTALDGCSPKNSVSNKRRRNYWYINNK